MKNEDRIIKALQDQLTSGRFSSLNELSAFLGLTETTKSKLYNVFNKDMNTGYKTICEWFDKLNIPFFSTENCNTQETDFQNPVLKAPLISRVEQNSPTEPVSGDNLNLIPVFGFTGAGNTVELVENEPIAYISILPQYNLMNMYPLKVSGDSMHPTIPKDSYVGITPYNGILQEGGVYLFETRHMGRTIKRIKINKSGILSLYSDNPEYDAIPLSSMLSEGEIIGRVMWVLRMP